MSKFEPDWEEVIHIEDKKKPKKESPQDKQMKEMLKQMGMDPNSFSNFNKKGENLGDMVGGLLDMVSDMLGGNIKIKKINLSDYQLGKIDMLRGEDFASILVTSSDDLYNEYIKQFPNEKEINKIDYVLTSITKELPIEDIVSLKYIDSTNKYILFFANLADLDEELRQYGFYLCAYKDENNNWKMFIPEYGNTFGYDEETEDVYTYCEGDDFLVEDNNGNLMFRFFNIDALKAGIDWYLTKKQNPLMTINLFGTVEKSLDPVEQDGKFICIGKIISNESADAILFKKDADLDVKKTEFPIYIKMSRDYTKETLRHIANKLFSVDWNNNPLAYTANLKYTPSINNKKIYIEIDFGE